MPIYEYRCTTCAKTFEVFAKLSDAPPTECEHCGAATIEKLLHPVGIHYKGSGFYSTDYGKKGSAGSSGGSSSESGGGESGSSGGSGGSGGSGEGGSDSSKGTSSSGGSEGGSSSGSGSGASSGD